MAEIRSMISSLIDKSQSQEISYWTIANRLEQTKRELTGHRAEDLEQSRNWYDLANRTLISQRHNQGALGTPKFPSYDPLDLKLEKNSKSTTQLGAARRNISFSGLDVVRTRQQECESLPAHTRNNSTKRQHKKQTRKPPTNPQNLENSSPTVPNVYHTKAADMTNNGARVEEDIPHDFFNLNQQREDLRNFADSGAFRNYIERNNAELRRIHSIMDMTTSSSPNIDRLIEEMWRTLFNNRISSVGLHHVWNIKFLEYSGNTNPKAHIRAFQLAISRAHLNDDGNEAYYCRFFAENFAGPALEWVVGSEGNSIDNFTQLVSAFLK